MPLLFAQIINIVLKGLNCDLLLVDGLSVVIDNNVGATFLYSFNYSFSQAKCKKLEITAGWCLNYRLN